MNTQPSFGGAWGLPPGQQHELVAGDRDLDRARRDFRVSAASFRTQALAESVFGGAVAVRSTGSHGSREGFQAMISLEVPFMDLGIHRWREEIFKACAGEDPILSQMALIFVFEPRCAERP